MIGHGYFAGWCYFDEKAIMKSFKVKQLTIKISGILLNLTFNSFRQNLFNKEVLK